MDGIRRSRIVVASGGPSSASDPRAPRTPAVAATDALARKSRRDCMICMSSPFFLSPASISDRVASASGLIAGATAARTQSLIRLSLRHPGTVCGEESADCIGSSRPQPQGEVYELQTLDVDRATFADGFGRGLDRPALSGRGRGAGSRAALEAARGGVTPRGATQEGLLRNLLQQV